MPTCAIKWCGNNTKISGLRKDGISFHRFPKIPAIKEKWIEATQRKNWYPQESSVICSRHYTPDCFDNTKKHRRLFSSAVPTIFLPILASLNDTSDMAVYNQDVPGPSHEYILPHKKVLRNKRQPLTGVNLVPNKLTQVNEDEASNPHNPSTSSIIRNALEFDIKVESTDNNAKTDSPLNPTVSLAEKALCRRVSDLTLRLRQSQLNVKKLQDKSRLLKKKLNVLMGSLDKLKDKGSVTQENIDIERLQASNRQLRQKVVMLRRLLNEQKKKNMCARRNVVWCPSAEGLLHHESDAEDMD